MAVTTAPKGERPLPRGWRWPTLAWRALAAAGLGLYTLAFAEAFIRVADPQPLMPRYVTGTPWGVRGNIPNAVFAHHTPEIDVTYHVNAQGLRADRDTPFAKPPGTCRVAMLGDSFFFGYELALPDTLAARLEAHLAQAGYRVEVLNFGVSGFGTAETMQTFDRYAVRFSPDLVLQEWHGSDFFDNVRSGLFRLQDGRLVRTADTYLPAVDLQDRLMRSAVYRLLNDHSHLYAFVREKATAAVKSLLVWIRREPPAASDDDSLVAADTVALSGALLQDLATHVQAAGARLLILEMPTMISRLDYRGTLDLFPPAMLRGLDIATPLQAYRSAARPDLKLYWERGNLHLTAAGAEIAARLAADRILAGGQLRGCDARTNAAPPADHGPTRR